MPNDQTVVDLALDSAAPTVTPLVRLLRQYAEVLTRLIDQQYVLKPVGPVDASIGGHTRHCLDHVRALIEATETGTLDYDHRKRDMQLELDRAVALDHIRDLQRQLTDLPDDIMDQDVALTTLVSPDEPQVTVRTTIGRELTYVLSHTVHHHALIAAMVKMLGGWLPNHFGYAPSTIAYRKNQVCVR